MEQGDSGRIIDLEALWAAYEKAAAGELDRTPMTIAKYRSAWRGFQAHAGRAVDVSGVLEATVRYREDLRRRRMATNTIYGLLAALKSVWRWAREVELVEVDPLERVRLPKKVSHPRPAIDKQAYEDLLGRLPQLEPIDRVIIAIAAYSGLRASEIRNLNADDIDIPAQCITVRQGKGRKDREVRMHPDLARILQVTREVPPMSIADRIRALCHRDKLSATAAAVRLGLNPKRLRLIIDGGGMQPRTAQLLAGWDREWPAEWWLGQAGPRRFGTPGRPLIVGRFGGRISKNAVYRTVRQQIEACPHQFRTTWITILLEHLVPIQVVADEAGHVVLDTTRAYIGRADVHARERMDAVRFGPPQPAPSVLVSLVPAVVELAPDREGESDECSPAQMAAYDEYLEHEWGRLLERNPWFPATLVRGLDSAEWWWPTILMATRLFHQGADPNTTIDCNGRAATIADVYAIGEFADNGFTGPPICLEWIYRPGHPLMTGAPLAT